MKKIMTDLLKYETGFLAFYKILHSAGAIKKNVFRSPKFWLVLVSGNVLFLQGMALVQICCLQRKKK